MKMITKNIRFAALILALFIISSCEDKLNNAPENTAFADETDYTRTENIILPMVGAYAEFYTRGWEGIPLISVRGDDVNAGGLGDQQPFADTDMFNYTKTYWMYNSLWEVFFRDIYNMESAIEQIRLYQEKASNKSIGDQYVAEARVLQGFLLLQMSRVWGDIFIPPSSDPSDIVNTELSTKEEVMLHISNTMDEVLDDLPSVHPRKRSDIPGGVTRFTALAVKALANLELGNHQAVADATSEIISSGEFALEPDFYELFKIKGKLNDEVLLELQYSDYGQPTGDANNYLMAFFGPQGAAYKPKVAGATGGWGFFEPSLKFIDFMLDREETVRLETSVLFTDRGIEAMRDYTGRTEFPDFVNKTTRSGDTVDDFARAMFSSGKHYLPSDQLTAGRTAYGSNKNYICIRYAEILLMHAEALVNGASSSTMSAIEAVNMVRQRANMPTLGSVTLDDVIDEKFAELAMEWGTRYYDLLRYERYSELSYDGRTFSSDLNFLPYPQNQVDQLPQLEGK